MTKSNPAAAGASPLWPHITDIFQTGPPCNFWSGWIVDHRPPATAGLRCEVVSDKSKKSKKLFLGRHLMLKKEYADKLLSGEKKTTIRLGIVNVKYSEVIIHSGGRPVAKARITFRNIKKVGELTDEDARLDGFPDKRTLVRELKRVYGRVTPDDYVTIIGLEVIQRFDEPVDEYPYGGLTPVDLARIALRYLKEELSREEKDILLELTRAGSIRLAAISLYGSIHKRWRIRRALRRAYKLLVEKGVLTR